MRYEENSVGELGDLQRDKLVEELMNSNELLRSGDKG